MNIVYIGLSYYPPQIWKTDIMKVSEEALKKGNTVTVLVKGWIWEPVQEKIWNMTIYRLPSRGENSIVDELIYIFAIPYFLKKNKINGDIFHIYNPFFLVFILNIFLRIVYPKSRIIFDIRTGPLKEWIKKILNYFLITLGHITASKTIVIHKGLLKNFFYTKEWSIYEVALGFEKNDSIPVKHLSSSKKYIYIGSIYPRRELWKMLDAFVQYLETYTEDTLTILGSWDVPYLQSLQEKYKSPNIIFQWSVWHKEVQSYLIASDYGVAYIPMVSFFMDQPPLKTIEYLGSGLPVIGTNTNGNRLFVSLSNWILTKDISSEFYQWLTLFREKFKEYKRESIAESVKQYEWKNIYSQIEGTIYT